jgi:hypothetical protein
MAGKKDKRPVADGDVFGIHGSGVHILSADFLKAQQIKGANFTADERFEVTDSYGEWQGISINRIRDKNSAYAQVEVGRPDSDTSSVSITMWGTYVSPKTKGAIKKDGVDYVNTHIESKPVHDSVQGAILRSMWDGKVSPDEATKLEQLRSMVTNYGLNDQKFDAKETQEIVNLAKTIAPTAEAKARSLKEVAKR